MATANSEAATHMARTAEKMTIGAGAGILSIFSTIIAVVLLAISSLVPGDDGVRTSGFVAVGVTAILVIATYMDGVSRDEGEPVEKKTQ